MRLIFNGGEPIAKATCDAFAAALGPCRLSPTAIRPAYGLAEASVALTIREVAAPVESVRILRDQLKVGQPVPYGAEDDVHSSAEIVCVGVPLAHCTLSIRDDDGEELSTDHYGHITARGPMISPGYYGGTEARQNGWLDTGDLGFIHRGALYIAGRAKDTIIVNGVNYHPNDLERVCCAEARIETGKVTCCML